MTDAKFKTMRDGETSLEMEMGAALFGKMMWPSWRSSPAGAMTRGRDEISSGPGGKGKKANK